MELEVERLTGRRPVFVVTYPHSAEGRPKIHPEKSILVVDDDASFRLLVRAVLKKRGCQVVEAGDSLEVIQEMEGQGQVGHLNMPNMDGLELMWALREDEDQGRLQ
jgi:CheY-like chemotaxis protein